MRGGCFGFGRRTAGPQREAVNEIASRRHCLRWWLEPKGQAQPDTLAQSGYRFGRELPQECLRGRAVDTLCRRGGCQRGEQILDQRCALLARDITLDGCKAVLAIDDIILGDPVEIGRAEKIEVGDRVDRIVRFDIGVEGKAAHHIPEENRPFDRILQVLAQIDRPVVRIDDALTLGRRKLRKDKPWPIAQLGVAVQSNRARNALRAAALFEIIPCRHQRRVRRTERLFKCRRWGRGGFHIHKMETEALHFKRRASTPPNLFGDRWRMILHT